MSDVEGSWSHAHEEDHDGLRVYRPSGHDLPPSRGRESFTLAEDRSAVRRTPGPTDRGASTQGTWRVEGGVLHVDLPGGSVAYEIVSAEPRRLELRPVRTNGGDS